MPKIVLKEKLRIASLSFLSGSFILIGMYNIYAGNPFWGVIAFIIGVISFCEAIKQ